jgi:hypothetical protein
MKLDLKFKENAQRLDLKFEQYQDLTDDGYERGYSQGYEDGTSEYGAITRGMVDGTLTEYRDEKLTSIRRGAFIYNSTITVVEAPNAKTMDTNVFTQCSNLQRASFPKLTSIGNDAFSYCSSMTYCDIGNAASIGSWVFTSCSKLEVLIIRKADSICELKQTNSINGNAIAKGTGFIYVPDHLVEQYKVATNWSTYANQIRAIEDYPEICG